MVIFKIFVIDIISMNHLYTNFNYHLAFYLMIFVYHFNYKYRDVYRFIFNQGQILYKGRERVQNFKQG